MASIAQESILGANGGRVAAAPASSIRAPKPALSGFVAACVGVHLAQARADAVAVARGVGLGARLSGARPHGRAELGATIDDRGRRRRADSLRLATDAGAQAVAWRLTPGRGARLPPGNVMRTVRGGVYWLVTTRPARWKPRRAAIRGVSLGPLVAHW